MVKRWTSPDALKRDCRWFRGDVPCKPHKQLGVHCVDEHGRSCGHYEQLTSRILIIKLGAIGDVIRTTPLLHRIKLVYPHAQIWWLTLTPEVVPSSVDVVLTFTTQGITILQGTAFDIIYNLDKDREACTLTATLKAGKKKGFTLKEGVVAPSDQDAVPKYMTGLFDDLNRENTKSYLQEIFDICGFSFEGENYILDSFKGDGYKWRLPRHKKVVGLNTGCGGRWIPRIWPEEHWVTLAKKLKKAGHVSLLLGGEQEHSKNLRIAKKGGALYLGHFPLRQFINLVDQCHLVVTAVTMAMHITIGLGKKIVLFNNIFNRNEFELYGLGRILEPSTGCTCHFTATCTNKDHAPAGCMRHLNPVTVFNACTSLLG